MKPPSASFDELRCLPLREAAALLGVAPVSLRRLWRRGGLRVVRVGGRLRVPVEEMRRIVGTTPPRGA
jgi:excisionase family DNA binding protein